MKLGKYSFGTGDRFGKQGVAQLKALLRAPELNVEITPVWNKSNREHQIIGTEPSAVRMEADEAVGRLGYTGAYYVDADHINRETVDGFISSSDFFTLDVAAYIGRPANQAQVAEAKKYLMGLGEEVQVAGLPDPIKLTEGFIDEALENYLLAIEEAAQLYVNLVEMKGLNAFITEVSMDEVEMPQTPSELFVILALLAMKKMPVKTIAPKFSGRFNKGVDYVGDVKQFAAEFEADILVIKHAISHFHLPDDLKLSIHSGSDKFSIYPIMGKLIRKHDAGIHIKTAGTTWLEEVIGLSLGDKESIQFIKEIYKSACSRMDELCGPYVDVIDINPDALPDNLDNWTGEQMASAFRHLPENPDYNPNMRQLMHVSYKLAAENLDRYWLLLERHADIIAAQVEENIFNRHLRRLF